MGWPICGGSLNAYSSTMVTPLSKDWPHQQAVTFWLPTAQQKKDGWWTAPPCLEILGWRDYLTQRTSMEPTTTGKWRRRKWLSWPWLSRGVQSNQECPWEYSAGALPVSCPLLEAGGLLNLEMLDTAKRDPMAPAPVSASPTPEPKEEEKIAL